MANLFLIPYSLFLILAFPLGLLLAKLTKDEKEIFTSPQYFPLLKKILLIISAITISQSEQIFLTSIFLLITIHTWQKA